MEPTQGPRVYLHRHPAFFGRFDDVKNDCCGSRPKAETEEEKEVHEWESKIYVSGKATFINDDPGRQKIGSFHPITDDDRTDMAYIGNTARLCQDIVDGELQNIQDWISQDGVDPNTRDYTGPTPLHLAVTSSTPEVVKALVDHGARLVARLADGKTALHLAAERGNVDIVKILMNNSIANEAEGEKQTQKRTVKSSEPDASPAEVQNAEAAEDSDSDMIDVVDEDEDDDDDDEEKRFATGSFVEVRKGKETATHDDAVPEEYETNRTSTISMSLLGIRHTQHCILRLSADTKMFSSCSAQ